MDAGLAAVLGALAGSAATIGAAVATGWAQREGARITARAEHRQQRREPRNVIYKDLVTAATDFYDAMRPWYSREVEQITPEMADTVKVCGRAVRDAWIETGLAGPREVGEAANRIEDRVASIEHSVTVILRMAAYDDQPSRQYVESNSRALLESRRDLPDRIEEFIVAARNALDDDGTMNLR